MMSEPHHDKPIYVYQVEMNGKAHPALYATVDGAWAQIERGVPASSQDPLQPRELSAHDLAACIVKGGAGYWKHMSIVRRHVIP
jgi:hypothetical protein